MSLTESLNAGAHGHIHELMGGTWSANWHEFRTRTEEIIFPFVHDIVVGKSFMTEPHSCAIVREENLVAIYDDDQFVSCEERLPFRCQCVENTMIFFRRLLVFFQCL